MKTSILGVALALTAAPASAVYLNPDATGQALIYPYYTVQSSSGNPFNTYVSVVNHGGDTKAIRVRFREGRLGAEVASFNLILGPHDTWAGAVIPVPGTNTGARVISIDGSCTDPPFEFVFSPPPLGDVPGITFSNTLYTGARADSAGGGLDRTRDGYIEMLEMGTRATAPSNCAAVRNYVPADWTPPTGGLSGTLTLINVASGMDFTVNADALAGLASRPYFRASADSYPGFDAAEIDPVSVVNANGLVYRSEWTRGLDAVSATLMRFQWMGEFVLDAVTRSKTDFVVTLPTRRQHATATTSTPPFTQPLAWSPNCSGVAGERLTMVYANREGAVGAIVAGGTTGQTSIAPTICASAAVADVTNGAAQLTSGTDGTFVLGSLTRGLAGGVLTGTRTDFAIDSSFANGTFEFASSAGLPLASLASSSRTDVVTGARTFGAHEFSGLPVVGFSMRTFENGTLECSAGKCQGNYGGAFPLRSQRLVRPFP